MASRSDQPRSYASTILMSLLFGLPIGLSWIGRIRAGLIVLALELTLGVSAILLLLVSPPLTIPFASIGPGLVFGLAYRALAVAVTLYLRARSLPGRLSQFWITVLLYLATFYLVVFLFRGLLYQPFFIPSGSMAPTLIEGDYLLVDKRAYGYSRYSFPYSPIKGGGRFLAADPKRGDIVVFRHPQDLQTDYIIRLVGLPGDTVQMRDGQLFLNGEPVSTNTEGSIPHQGKDVEIKRETLPSGRSYLILDTRESPSADNTRMYEVPEAHYFMLGDNRDNSNDSRFAVGFVPFENLVGKAVRVFWNANGDLDPDRQDLIRN